MRWSFFLREALRGLRRSSAPALAALLTVLLTAVVLGVFIPIVQATTGTANEVRSRVVVDVYVKDSATQLEQAELRKAIENTNNVKSVEFISKGEALARAKEKNPKAFEAGAELLGSNPLPASFRVYPEDPDKLGEIVTRLNAGGEPQLAAIDEVRDREDDTNKILSATGLVKALTGGLAVLLLGVVKATFLDPLADRFALLAAPDTIDFPLLVAVLMVACIAVSALGSGIT